MWNRIPPEIHDQIIELALEQSELRPRELAVRFTDEQRYFVSESTVYRLLKAHDLITSPAYVVIKAADRFRTKTIRPNAMWQNDFTYFNIIGWGWMYLSTVLDDYSRYIIAWKLDPQSPLRVKATPGLRPDTAPPTFGSASADRSLKPSRERRQATSNYRSWP